MRISILVVLVHLFNLLKQQLERWVKWKIMKKKKYFSNIVHSFRVSYMLLSKVLISLFFRYI